MKIFVFWYKNYFDGRRTYRVLAHTREEAWEILMNCPNIKKFIYDDDTEKIDEWVVELDEPKIIN